MKTTGFHPQRLDHKIWGAARAAILRFNTRHEADAKPAGKSAFIDGLLHLTEKTGPGQDKGLGQRPTGRSKSSNDC